MSRFRRNVGGLPVVLFVSDVAALTVSALLVGGDIGGLVTFGLVGLVVRSANRYYRQRMSLAVLDDVPRALVTVVVAVGLSFAVSQVVDLGAGFNTHVLDQALLFLAFGLVLQKAAFVAARRARRTRLIGRRTLIVGADQVGRTLTDALLEHPELGLTPVGYADPDGRAGRLGPLRMPVLASDMAQLPRAIIDHQIDTTIVALQDSHVHVDTVMTVQRTGCELLVVPAMFEMHHDGADVERIRGVPLIRLRSDPTLRLSWWIKRGFDVAVGAVGLLALALPMALVCVAILIDSGRPVMFWQERIGVDGRPFRLCKFRSMRPESEHESQTTWNIGSDPRVSAVGRLLRRTSIDEIPQLWNIIRGHMSLVGPRPERPGFVEKFTREHERYWARHRVPVGLTGLAQVNGLRGDTSIQERARFDNYYIANWSLWLDLKIILLTFREVFGGHGR